MENKSTEIQILAVVKKKVKNSIFFPEDFLEIANSEAIRKALQRLVEKKKITRITHGIYVLPKQSKLIGEVLPSAEELAKAIVKRDKARIIPTGTYALNALGLSTQVPLKLVYLTDGAPRTIKVGNRTIVFRKTTPKNLAVKGELSSLAIQALKAIGNEKVKAEEEKKIIEILKSEDKKNLMHDIKLAPIWIANILKKSL
jgi:hypothetical protein